MIKSEAPREVEISWGALFVERHYSNAFLDLHYTNF